MKALARLLPFPAPLARLGLKGADYVPKMRPLVPWRRIAERQGFRLLPPVETLERAILILREPRREPTHDEAASLAVLVMEQAGELASLRARLQP